MPPPPQANRVSMFLQSVLYSSKGGVLPSELASPSASHREVLKWELLGSALGSALEGAPGKWGALGGAPESAQGDWGCTKECSRECSMWGFNRKSTLGSTPCCTPPPPRPSHFPGEPSGALPRALRRPRMSGRRMSGTSRRFPRHFSNSDFP